MSVGFTAAGLILSFIVFGRCRALTGYGLSLIAAGAIGNALDRLLLGSVVDFADASKMGFVWVFNLADAVIDVGICLVLISAFFGHPSGDNKRSGA